jgi:hypothetical protein
MTLVAGGRTMLRESRADVLAFPGLLGVLLIVGAVRVLTARHPQVAAIVVCAVLVIVDIVAAWFMLSTGRAKFVVTAQDITFTPRQGRDHRGAQPQVIQRTAGSTLSFRLQSGGIIGGQPVYRLKLRDDATGHEVSAVPFGRVRVRRACESQGWPFS